MGIIIIFLNKTFLWLIFLMYNKNGNDIVIYLKELLRKLNELMHAKSLKQCRVHKIKTKSMLAATIIMS